MLKNRSIQRFIGRFFAFILTIVWKTSRVSIVSSIDETPVIFAMWHGEHFLVPFAKKPEQKTAVLISKHRDGEIFSQAIESLGLKAVRGAGAHGHKIRQKGGAVAFLELLTAIKDGYSIAMTADVPKVSRVCGAGIIKLAEHSGLPIYPVAVVSKWHITLKSWDKSAIGLPFSKVRAIAAEPLWVEKGASDEKIEELRLELQARLNAITAKAYAEV